MIRKLRGRKVIVSTEQETFRGTLAAVGWFFVRLEPFEFASGDAFVPADGSVLVRRARINSMQVL